MIQHLLTKFEEEMYSVCIIQVATLFYIVYHVSLLDYCDAACRYGNSKRYL